MTAHLHPASSFLFFFFNAPAPTEIYTLSLHDALPIFEPIWEALKEGWTWAIDIAGTAWEWIVDTTWAEKLEDIKGWLRSEEHTSELQSRPHLVCRLLLEKKKKKSKNSTSNNASLTPLS